MTSSTDDEYYWPKFTAVTWRTDGRQKDINFTCKQIVTLSNLQKRKWEISILKCEYLIRNAVNFFNWSSDFMRET